MATANAGIAPIGRQAPIEPTPGDAVREVVADDPVAATESAAVASAEERAADIEDPKPRKPRRA